MTRLAQNYLHLLDEIPTFVEADRKLLRSRKHKKDLDMTDSSRLEYMMMLSKLTKLRQKIEYFFFQHIFVSIVLHGFHNFQPWLINCHFCSILLFYWFI